MKSEITILKKPTIQRITAEIRRVPPRVKRITFQWSEKRGHWSLIGTAMRVFAEAGSSNGWLSQWPTMGVKPSTLGRDYLAQTFRRGKFSRAIYDFEDLKK